MMLSGIEKKEINSTYTSYSVVSSGARL